MPHSLSLHPGRLLPADPVTRTIAGRLYANVVGFPIISQHRHTDPSWWATGEPFGNATKLLLYPNHYVFRMLYSQGVSLKAMSVGNQRWLGA